MAGLKALDTAFGFVKGFFKRKDDKLEKDAGKSALSGDVDKQRDITNKLYPSKSK